MAGELVEPGASRYNRFMPRVFPGRTFPLLLFLLAACAGLFDFAVANPPSARQPYRPPDRESVEALDRAMRLPRAELARQVPAAWRVALAGQADFDVLDYNLALDVHPSDATIAGELTMRARSLVSALTVAPVDLWEGMTVTTVTGPSGALPFTRGAHDVRVTLDRAYAVDEEFEFSIAYGGAPTDAGWGSFVFLHHGSGPDQAQAIATLSEPYYARTWWPSKDIPSDKATVTLAVTVPETLVVAAPGVLQAVTPNGDGTSTWRWREEYPITTYLVSLAITNYVQLSSMYTPPVGAAFPITHYVYPEDSVAAAADFSILPAMLDHQIGLFGEYPFPLDKYGMAEFPLAAAMEHQTMTSYPDFIVTGTHSYDRVIAHELAHQWFGDMVSPADWREIWLNEGFARYAEALWEEELGGEAAYRAFLEYLVPFAGDFTGTVYDPAELFGATVYNKGAWVLHMLRFVMGEAPFFDALRAYLAAHAYGNATSEDFQAACESVHGADLSWFFDAWLHQRYRPSYRIWWKNVETGGGYDLQLHIDQVQEGSGFFPMPLQVRMTRASGDTTLTVFNDEQDQLFTLPMTEHVTALTLDPDDHVLKHLTVIAAPGATGVESGPGGAKVLALAAPSPNPSRGEVELTLHLEDALELDVAVYDLRGRRIQVLSRGPLGKGVHRWRWDGRTMDGEIAPAGVYVCEARAGTLRDSQLMVRLP